MTNLHTNEPTRQPLRLWPGVIIVALQWLLRFVVPIIIPEALTVGVMGGLVCGLRLSCGGVSSAGCLDGNAGLPSP